MFLAISFCFLPTTCTGQGRFLVLSIDSKRPRHCAQAAPPAFYSDDNAANLMRLCDRTFEG
jgi:hypothetical protein